MREMFCKLEILIDCCILFTDLMGKAIRSFPLEKGYHTLSISTSEMLSGIYLLIMKDIDNKSLIAKKIIIQK